VCVGVLCVCVCVYVCVCVRAILCVRARGHVHLRLPHYDVASTLKAIISLTYDGPGPLLEPVWRRSRRSASLILSCHATHRGTGVVRNMKLLVLGCGQVRCPVCVYVCVCVCEYV